MAIVRFTLCQQPLETVLAKHETEYLPKFQVDQWVKLFNGVVCKGHSDPEVSQIVEENRERFLKELNDVGSPILFGTDSPNLFEVPGFSVYEELAAMQQAGLSPYDVLLSGTRRVGEYLRKDVGTLTVGAEADLILLDGNPLEDLANVRKQAGVMLRGQWLTRAELQSKLQNIHDLPANYRMRAEKAVAR